MGMFVHVLSSRWWFMFQVGQWVLYRQTAAYILQADHIGNRYLIQAPSVSEKEYWIPGDYLKANEDVTLLEEDIRELKAVAVKTGDFHWYRELSGHTA